MTTSEAYASLSQATKAALNAQGTTAIETFRNWSTNPQGLTWVDYANRVAMGESPLVSVDPNRIAPGTIMMGFEGNLPSNGQIPMARQSNVVPLLIAGAVIYFLFFRR